MFTLYICYKIYVVYLILRLLYRATSLLYIYITDTWCSNFYIKHSSSNNASVQQLCINVPTFQCVSTRVDKMSSTFLHACTCSLAHLRIRGAFACSHLTGESVERLCCILRIFVYQVCWMRRRVMFTGIVPRVHNTVTCVHVLSQRCGSLTRITNFTQLCLYLFSFFPFIVIPFQKMSRRTMLKKQINFIIVHPLTKLLQHKFIPKFCITSSTDEILSRKFSRLMKYKIQ